jgi:hypothetical protein
MLNDSNLTIAIKGELFDLSSVAGVWVEISSNERPFEPKNM